MTNRNTFSRSAVLTFVATVAVAIPLMHGCRSSNPYPDAATKSLISGDLSSAVPAVNPQPAADRLERGRYLVEGPMHCFMCHSDSDWKLPGGKYVSERKGAGHKWADFGFPFLIAPNISPDPETGAGKWTDETFARAIREGVGHDGRRLFPIMPYMLFRKMSDEDLASVLAYIRSIPPVRNQLPTTVLPDEIRNSLPPHQAITEPVPEPDLSDPVRRGEYLVTLGNCTECHTPKDEHGAPLPGLDFAGGFVMTGPWGEVASANITSDPSGISYYDEALFIKTIRTGQVQARKLNSVMPWIYFRNMTDDDLKAIFAYLRTLRPVQHRVDNTEKPSHCSICGGVHGFGNRNVIN